MIGNKPQNIDEYIQNTPEHSRQKLVELRSILKTVAPEAQEALKWGRPFFIEKRILFSFAAFNNYLTFMPTAPALEPFREKLAGFKPGKHTIQFPYDQPLPHDLIVKIAEFRRNDVLENDARWMQ